MYFDAKPIDLEGATLAKGDPAGVDEMFEATREAQLRINNQYARADQLEKEIDARNDEILKATGEKLDNPFRMSFRADDLPEYMKFMEGRNPTELPGYSLLNFNNQKMMAQGYYFDRYEKRLKELADQKPDLAHIIRATEPPSMVVARRMRETEEKTADVFGRRGWTGTNPVGTMWDAVRDLPGTAAMFGGSLAGQAFSPTDMIGNLVGLASGGSMSIVRSALRNAVSNMAVQTALEPGVAAQRTQAGLDYGAVDALNSVLGAGAFGFAIDAIPRSINRPLVNRFGPDTPAGTFLSRNTPRGGFLTDAPINPIPGVVVDPGQIQAATDVIQAAQGQARNPELQALVDKASKGDIEAVRELASRAGVLEDPTIKGMFDHARIAGFDPGFADKVNAEFERVGLKERVDVGETEIRQAKTVVAAMDPTAEPFPVEAMRFVNEQRFPDLSNDVDLPAGTTGTNQHGRYLEIDGRTATVRTIDLKLATAADDIKTLRGRVDGLRGDWDQGQAGRALALEGKDGALRIVDGRGRLELAQRSQGEARAEAVVFRESDGWSIRDVEGLALLKNIREGKGDVVEAATVFRERPELLEGVLAATDFERQALALSRLSEAAFEMVQTGKADPRLAAVVAQYVGDQGRHAGVLDDLARMGVRDPDLARQTVPDLVPPRETAAANHVLLGVREGFDDAVPTLRGGAEVDEPLGSAAKAQTDRLGQELAPEVALAQKAAKQIADMEEKVGDIQREMTGEIERLTRQIERQRKNVTESRLAADRFSPETNKSFKNFTRRFRDREAFNRAEDNANARAAADQDLLKKLETDLAAKMEELGPKRVELNEAETDLANARRGVDGEKLYRQTMGAIALKREQDIRLAVSQALGLADRITPEGTKVAVVDDLKSPDGRALDAASDMATGDIQLVLSAVDPMAKIGHEAVHTLVTKGHLSPDEVKQLTALAREAKTFEPAEWGDGDKSFKTRAEAEAYAKAENKTIVALNDEARYRDAYADRPNLETLIDEEAAASYIEARIKGTVKGPANTIVERVKQLLERIKQALAGFGFKSREDVVQAILNGEAARRAPVQEWMRAAPSDVGRVMEAMQRQVAAGVELPDGTKINGVKLYAIRAFHGSPHDFDRFDLSKIGTGEGAQAFGHGLYFAENEGVAKGYRDKLAGANLEGSTGNANVDSMLRRMFGGDWDKAKASGYLPADEVARIEREGLVPKAKSSGRMYEVRINADPEHFLDWDKPLSQQSEKVRQAASKAWGIPEQQLHDELFARNVPEQISKKLRDEGVAGVKYLDQGSRVKGEGTRNYVVFDDNLIEIVAKDGTPVQGDKLYSLRSDDGPVIRGYHGTRATQKFDKFEIERSRNIGIHIGDVEDANMFAGTEPGLPLDFYSKVDRIEPPRLRDATMAALEGGRIIPVEMRFKNILRVPDLIREMKLDVWQPKKVAEVLEAHGVAFKKEDDAILSEARFASGKSWRPHDPDRWNQSPPGMAEANALIRQRVMEAGYDAIEYDGVDSGSGKPVYIVIKPGTVRNAASGDMMFSLRSDLDMSPEARKQRAEQRKNVEYVTLYHGTTDEGYDAIQSSGRVSAPAFFTPRRDVAESYGARVVEVRVPKDKLMIDFDLPGAKLLDLESANGYRDNPDWTIDDYLRHGQSVGVNDDVPLDPSKSDSPNLMYSMREDDPSPKDQIKATVRAYAEAYRDLKSNADALGVSPDDLAELVQGRFNTNETWYHGTKAQFDTPDPAAGSTPGFWITKNKSAASALGEPGSYVIKAERFGTLMDFMQARMAASQSGLEPGTREFSQAVIDRLAEQGFDGIRDPKFKGVGGDGEDVAMILSPNNIRRTPEQLPPLAQKLEAARAQLAQTIGDEQATALTRALIAAAPLMPDVEPRAIADMVDNVLDQMFPDPPPPKPDPSTEVPTPLQKDMIDMARLEETQALVSVCRGI